MTLNERLKAAYQPYLENLRIVSKHNADKFSCPLLMKVFPEYEKVRQRILFIGKETYEWIGTLKNTHHLTVDYLMNSYEEFQFGKNYHGRNSPFWRFIREVHQKVNGNEFPNGLLWTNFSKCDSGGTTPTKELQQLNNNGFDLIKTEIEITNPDLVIFITGWDYAHQFQRVFKGLQYDTVEDNYIYKCIHPSLPENSFMTMHPKGLQLRKKLNSTVDKIIEQI